MKLSKRLLQTLQYSRSVAIIFLILSYPAVWQTQWSCPVASCRLFRSAYRPRWWGYWYARLAAHEFTQDDMSALLQLVILTDPGPFSTLFVWTWFLFPIPMTFLATSTTWWWMNGVCHMENSDIQLSTPAQQFDSDLSGSSPPHLGLQAEDGEHHPPPAKWPSMH